MKLKSRKSKGREATGQRGKKALKKNQEARNPANVKGYKPKA